MGRSEAELSRRLLVYKTLNMLADNYLAVMVSHRPVSFCNGLPKAICQKTASICNGGTFQLASLLCRTCREELVYSPVRLAYGYFDGLAFHSTARGTQDGDGSFRC